MDNRELETSKLIVALVADAKPVRRLKPPSLRAVLWSVACVPAIALIVWYYGGIGAEYGTEVRQPSFVIESLACLLTGLTAAAAALNAAIPGRSQRLLLLPLIPLSVWLAALCYGCWHDWVTLGVAGVELDADWGCAAQTALMAIVPGLLFVMLLRRLPIRSPAIAGVSALAIASFAVLGTSLYHTDDSSLTFLFWHVGAAAVITCAGFLIGRRLPPLTSPSY